ncbi:M48 family metalloprotease [Brevundimonas sp.]|uniref:M48 family metalloprotease n=1 Tax=Brevundimonas sp. TaxID=1871086 RepID=UPI0025CCAA0B|nr:M48 family metalloprotease [Brevundimonas sp.]
MRGRLLGFAWALALLAAAAPASAQLGRFLPGRGYAVDGREGPYLTQVDPREISQRVGTGPGLAFASEAGNQGAHRGQRLRMPRTEAAIAALIAELDAPWPHDPRLPVQVHILASGFYAPMALPDGSIMVPLGLIAQAETDDELAYILGHELAHVRLGHFADDQGFREQRRNGQRLADAYGMASMLYQMRPREDGSIAVGGDDRSSVRAAAASDQLNTLINVFAEPAWARGQEDEADALAFDLSEAAGFNALDAADAAFGRMEADFNTRRALAEAMEGQLSETVADASSQVNLNAVAAGDLRSVGNSLLNGLARSGGRRAFEFASGYFGQRHRPPDARSEGLSTYADRAYPDLAAFRDPQEQRLTAIRASDEYLQAIVAVDALQAAQELRREGDLEGALTEIQRAQATPYGGSAVILNAAAGINADLGRIDEAEALYTQANRQEEQGLDGYVAHVRMLIRAGRRDRARQVIHEGAARFGGGELGEKAFLPSLVAVSFADGQEREGLVYLRRCRAYAEERLTQDCTLAALSPNDPQQYENLSPETRREVDAAVRTNSTDRRGLGLLDNFRISIPGG